MRYSAIAALALLLTACAETDTLMPPMQADLISSGPTFYRFLDDAYSAAETSGSFWAVKGQHRSITLRYRDTGAQFLEFVVPESALARWPDGTPFEPGDSVLISVQVDAHGDFTFHFSPSGLDFDDDQPARLTLNYGRTDPDINGDGSVDATDQLLMTSAGIWKRELPGLPWISVATLNVVDSATAHANILDFTGFGMAVN